MKFFLDTYALIEIAEANDVFKKYLDSEAVTLKDNIVELYYYLLRRHGEAYANQSLNYFSQITEDFDLSIIPRAMKSRLAEKRRNKNFSYIDMLGYTFARKNNFIFITGDRSFSNFEGAEIVR